MAEARIGPRGDVYRAWENDVTKAQVILDDSGNPAFAGISWREYERLTTAGADARLSDEELYERGRRTGSARTLAAIAEASSIDLDALIRDRAGTACPLLTCLKSPEIGGHHRVLQNPTPVVAPSDQIFALQHFPGSVPRGRGQAQREQELE